MTTGLPLSPEFVRLYIHDDPANNYLLNGVQFDDEHIAQCINLAVSTFNLFPPFSNYTTETFPNQALLLWGTLHHLYNGAAALAARNQLTYSDAGLQIPIEERYELYSQEAIKYRASFEEAGKQMKLQMNVEGGWGYVVSDYARFPGW